MRKEVVYMGTLKITKDNFEKEVMQSNVPVLLDFFADWCGPCKMVSPVVEEISKDLGEKVKIGKINIDEQEELARNYKVMSIPTLVLLKDGKVVSTSVGAKPKNAILKMFDEK